MTAGSFGARLRKVVGERGPLCVGIDPHPALLERWGLADDPNGLARFTDTVVEALGERVAVLKPQAAFYERHGSLGLRALERAIEAIRAAGALSIVDAKRGDIGSTMAAYADAYAGAGSPLAGDAVTASPYLGFESLRPRLTTAAATGRGVFVLALTSNPEGGQVQHATGADGRTVAQTVLDAVAAENAGAEPLGSVGAVIGATITGAGREHAFTHLNGPVLAPGFGAQGGSAADLRAVFGAALGDVLPTTSREVLSAGPDLDALREAAARSLATITAPSS